MKINSIIISIIMMVVTLFGCSTIQDVAVQESPVQIESQAFEVGIKEIMKYGHLVLDIDLQTLLDAGFEYGDIIKVNVNGHEHMIPFCTDYTDVDTGNMLIRAKDKVIVAINMRNFASANGIAEKEKHEDGTYRWIFPEGKTIKSYTVKLEMAEKYGYKEEYLIHRLDRTNNREDYSTDSVFANFREISTGKLGKGVLFRSSSPINPELGRASYADEFAKANGIQRVMNLADSAEKIEGFKTSETFDSPYYYALFQAGKVKPLNLSIDFMAPDFKDGLADGIRFFATNEGPYLVHCTEGKDRAGFVSALLASFMNASFEEVVEDYMITYENYYHIEKNSEQWIAVKNSNIVKMLEIITNSKTPETEDLALASENYIRSLGITDAEIKDLKDNLSMNYR